MGRPGSSVAVGIRLPLAVIEGDVMKCLCCIFSCYTACVV